MPHSEDNCEHCPQCIINDTGGLEDIKQSMQELMDAFFMYFPNPSRELKEQIYEDHKVVMKILNSLNN